MSGHISVRDPEFPEYIWMNPLGKHFGLMTAGDLICLDVNTGKIVGGNKVCLLSPWSPTPVKTRIVQTSKCSRFLDSLWNPQGTSRRSCYLPRPHECRQSLVSFCYRARYVEPGYLPPSWLHCGVFIIRWYCVCWRGRQKYCSSIGSGEQGASNLHFTHPLISILTL